MGYTIYELLIAIEVVDLKFQLNRILTKIIQVQSYFHKFQKNHMGSL
jgi:hypothetical protein